MDQHDLLGAAFEAFGERDKLGPAGVRAEGVHDFDLGVQLTLYAEDLDPGLALDDSAAYAAHRPDLFAKVFGGDMDYLVARNPYDLVQAHAEQLRGRTQIRLLVGGLDPLRESDAKFHRLLERLGLPHFYFIAPEAGHHYGRIVDALGDEQWKFWA